MKFKKASLISVCLVIFSLVLLFSFNFKTTISHADGYNETDVADSYYLVDNSNGEEVFLSNLTSPVGKVYGYGKFKLGETKTITAEAQQGFKLVGFQVVYLEQENKTEFLSVNGADLSLNVDDEGYTYFEKTLLDANGTEVQVSVKFLDSNLDNYFDQGKFVVSQVFENIEVNAVFDYIYNDVDISSFIDLTDVTTSYSQLPLDDGVIYYLNNSLTEAGQYENAILNKGNSYLYLGTIFADDINAPKQYFKMHNKATDAGEQTKVNINAGAFRSDEIVNLQMNILSVNNKDALDVYLSKNIDLLGIRLEADENVNLAALNELQDNSFVKTTDATNRTSSFKAQFNVVKSANHVINVKLVADNLYVANLNFVFDGNEANEEEFSLALKNLTITNYFYKFEDANLGKYFVKTLNNNQFFRVVANLQINEIVNNKTYNYYNFVSLDGYFNNAKSYNAVNTNFNINILYNSANYVLNFEAKLLVDNNLINPPINFNILESIILKRGESCRALAGADAPTNVGYKFLGYTENANATQLADLQNENFISTISKQTPENKTIYLVYENINYTVKLTNINQINLNNGADIYPISNIFVRLNNNAQTLTNQTNLNECVLTTNLQIFDNFSFTVSLNNGFKIVNANLNKQAFNFESLSYSFVLDNDLILSCENETLTIELSEDFISYEFRYFIEKREDPFQHSNVIMADITADKQLTNATITEHKNEYADRDEIVISNLKLYDVVRLNAVSKLRQDEEGRKYHYSFNKFTQNDRTNLNYFSEPTVVDEENLQIYYMLFAVGLNNLPVKVVYSMQEGIIIVQSNMDAYAFFDDADISTITVEGATTNRLDENNSVKVSDGDTITLSLNTAYISLGYKLTKFVYNDTDYGVVNGGSVTITVAGSQDGVGYLYVHFEEIKYKIAVYQSGAGELDGDENSRVNFGGEEPYYKIITISSRELNFEMPEGYFVNNLYFLKDDSRVENRTINSQSNDYLDNTFNYSFTNDDIINLLVYYGEDVGGDVVSKILVEYKIHTFSIRVNFGLTNPKNNDMDNYIIYPSMKLTYTFNKENFNFTTNRTRLFAMFNDIPYGAENATIVVNLAELPVGYEVSVGFTNVTGVRRSLTGDVNSLQINKITNSLEYNFMVDYISYNANLIYSIFEGSPNIYINSRNKNTLFIYDSILIDANGNRLSGFKFDYLYYFAPIQEGDATDEIYIYNNATNEFELHSGSMDDGTNYYKKVIYSTANRFIDNSFTPNNYAIINKNINFYLQYKLIEISVSHQAENINYSLQIGDVNLSADDYSNYVVYLLDENGQRLHALQQDEKLNYNSIIEIEIALRTFDMDNNPLTTYNNFELCNGINLNYLFAMNQRQYDFQKTGKNTYLSANIRLSEIMQYIQDDDILIFNYQYFVNKKSVNITTNITNLSFYNKFNMELLPAPEFNVDGKIAENGNISSEQYFLTNVRFRCSFNDVKLYKNFNISQLVIKINGNTVAYDDWARNGIQTTYVNYDAAGAGRDNHGLYIYFRFLFDANLTIQIQPIITGLNENADTTFVKIFDCDEFGNGKVQGISIGAVGSNSDIEMDDLFFENGNSIAKIVFETDPINVGEYRANLKFETDGEFAWLKDINWPYSIFLQIDKKPITISPDILASLPDKVYNGKDDFGDVESLLGFLQITPLGVKLNENVTLLNIKFNYTTINAKMSSNKASSTPHDIYITGLELMPNRTWANNNNFYLTNSEVTLINCVKIVPKSISLKNIEVYDKLYDGTRDAHVNLDNLSFNDLDIVHKEDGTLDDVRVDFSKLHFIYEGNELDAPKIGTNKNVILENYNVLIGEDSANYVLNLYNPISLKAGIYPDKVLKQIEGVGTITIFNRLGQTDHTKVNLIPTDDSGSIPDLVVEVIGINSSRYSSIHALIAQSITNNSEYKVGYSLGFKVGNMFIKINNELFLSLPKEEHVVGGFYLTGTRTGNVKFVEENNALIIDLSQLDVDINTFYFTVQRALLQWWQLLIIILLLLLLIILFIIIIVILKRRKERKNEMYERI